MLMSCRSASSLSSWKIFSIRPLSDHSLNRLYTVCHGPYRSGRSRHDAPLRMPLSPVVFPWAARDEEGVPRLPFEATAAAGNHAGLYLQ